MFQVAEQDESLELVPGLLIFLAESLPRRLELIELASLRGLLDVGQKEIDDVFLVVHHAFQLFELESRALRDAVGFLRLGVGNGPLLGHLLHNAQVRFAEGLRIVNPELVLVVLDEVLQAQGAQPVVQDVSFKGRVHPRAPVLL